MRSSLLPLCLLTAILAAQSACAGKVDAFAMNRLVPRGSAVADTDLACTMGAAFVHPIAAMGKPGKPPPNATITAEFTAAICAEGDAWEAELDAVRVERLMALGSDRIPEVKDARIAAERLHALAGQRFYRSFLQLEATYGPAGEGCPRIPERDELAYLLGLAGGTIGLLHDRASGGQVGIPLDTLGKVARASVCLDDARWWSVPSALQAGAWATIPGSGPEGVDPWQQLAAAADSGDLTGVRVARALFVRIHANAGHTDEMARGIQTHAASLTTTAQDPTWALFDEYALMVSQHQSDLHWIREEGHRSPSFGTLPEPGEATPAQPNPFEDDPFSEDPFGDAPAETP